MRKAYELLERSNAALPRSGWGFLGIAALSLVLFGALVVKQTSAQTGATTSADASAVAEIILSRQMLMIDMQRLMAPIDAATTGETVDPELLKSAASSIAAMMNATAHLFPADSNRYDPTDAIPQTSALPALWDDFASFAAMARASGDAAFRLSLTDEPSIVQRAQQLRASCDACHGLFLVPYEPPSVSDEELDFDLDGLFDSFE